MKRAYRPLDNTFSGCRVQPLKIDNESFSSCYQILKSCWSFTPTCKVLPALVSKLIITSFYTYFHYPLETLQISSDDMPNPGELFKKNPEFSKTISSVFYDCLLGKMNPTTEQTAHEVGI